MTPTAQQYICDSQPYQPGLPIELVAREYGLEPENIIKLASNENPLGMSQGAQTAIRRATQEVHRYPEQYNLVQALSDKLGVAAECLVLGNGSNDVLDLIARTFLDSGSEAVSSEYAFAVYAISTQATGAKNVIVPANEFGHDLCVMLQAITPATKVVWLANPNNPTGTFIPYKEVKEFVETVPRQVVVVLDEAYREYLPPEEQADTVAWLAEHPNLVLVRTFSKIYGLAGLRIGYAIAARGVAELLNRVRQPFNANSLAIAAATAALGDDEFVEHGRQANALGRAQLLKGLDQLGLACMPAHGNFVTFHIKDAAQANQLLLKQGIIVRPLAGYNLADWLRATVGLPEENERLILALQKLTG